MHACSQLRSTIRHLITAPAGNIEFYFRKTSFSGNSMRFQKPYCLGLTFYIQIFTSSVNPRMFRLKWTKLNLGMSIAFMSAETRPILATCVLLEKIYSVHSIFFFVVCLLLKSFADLPTQLSSLVGGY